MPGSVFPAGRGMKKPLGPAGVEAPTDATVGCPVASPESASGSLRVASKLDPLFVVARPVFGAATTGNVVSPRAARQAAQLQGPVPGMFWKCSGLRARYSSGVSGGAWSLLSPSGVAEVAPYCQSVVTAAAAAAELSP